MQVKFNLTSHFFVSDDGVNIHYLKTSRISTKPCLIFLHGAGGDATAWKAIQQICFEAGYPSVAMDLRGHGLSDDPIGAGAYVFKKLAQDVDELIDKLGLTKIILVGHCFGGMVSMIFAANEHKYLSGLILVDTSDTPSIFGLPSLTSKRFSKLVRRIGRLFPLGKKQVRPTYDIFVGTKDIDLKRFISDVKYTSPRSYLFCYGDIMEFETTGLLEKIQTRTLVVCGEDDIIFPVRVSRKLASRIPGSELKVVPEANHVIVINNPKALSNIIIDFSVLVI